MEPDRNLLIARGRAVLQRRAIALGLLVILVSLGHIERGPPLAPRPESIEQLQSTRQAERSPMLDDMLLHD